MNLANRFLQPTDCFLVAFDIVSSSQNLANSNGLGRDRRALFEAINQTALVRQCTRSESVVGQFLGDEFRLAFPTTHNGVAINASAVVEFIDEVFEKLENPTLGYAPVIRAALTNGPIRSMELRKFCYLSGGIALSQLTHLLDAIDGKNNLLITNLEIQGCQQVSDLEKGSLYTKSYTHRDVPSPYTGPVDPDLDRFFVLAITNEHRVVDQTLRDFANACLEGFEPARISISPSSILFVFKEASFSTSKAFLASIRNQATVYRDGLQIAAAIAYGLGLEIEEKDWLPKTFESGTAIEVCRLLAKLPPGALTIPDDPAQLELFSPLSRQLKEKLELPGKRKEVFKCVIDRSYFPKKDPPKTDPPPPDTPDPPEPPKPLVIHQKPAITQEQFDTHRPQAMPLTDQDWMIIDDIFTRVPPFNESSRDAFLIRIAKTPAQKNAIANLSNILGHQDFYVTLQAFVRSSEDEGLEQRTFRSMLNYVINEKDRTVLQRLIQERFAAPQNPAQVPGPPVPQIPPTFRNGVVTSIEFTLDRPLGEFDESAFKSAFRQCTGIDAKMIRIASIRSGSTIVRVEGDSNVLQRVVEQFRESQEKLDLFCQLTGLTSLQWIIDGRSYKLDMLQANELTPLTRYTNTDDKDAGRNMTYTIGIITALEKEYAAVKALLKDCKAEKKQGHGAGRSYVGGKIASISGGEHNVVLALADMGNNVAATRATLLLSHFPTIETVLMVGIAGGVPSPKKLEDHVRLGDVVISNKKGVVQYDMVKLQEIRACPIPPSAEMIESVRLLGADALLGKQPWNSYIDASLHSIGSERPPDTTDILFDSKNPEVKIQHPVDPKRTRGLPRVFLGPIASANELLKDPIKRDELRDRFGVKAVEMEGSGIADATWTGGKGYLVIRGICDYCDSHKNDSWQEYASAVAAGYAVALIESMPTSGPPSANNVLGKMPSSKNMISIPSPDKDAITVTPDSEISSSPPSVPPKNPLEFFRLQIDNLLKGNDEITKNFYNLLPSDEKKVKSDVVADHLVRLDDSNSTEYPLLRLRRLMKKLSDQRLTLDHSYRTVFVSMMDILSVASFPDEDRDRMENAMVEVLRSNPEIGTKIQLSTALPEDVKRLLILTRLKLAAKKFDDFAIDRILNNDYQEGESGSPLFEIVRPVIISEPFILPPDGRSITSYYAEKILESFNSSMPRTDFEGCLTHELKERKGSDGDGEVIALLLSNEASKNAQILQKAFPLLLVIVLERENALRYDTVLLDRNEIEKFLKKILRNPQK